MAGNERTGTDGVEIASADTLRLDEAGLARAAAQSQPRSSPPARVAGYDIQRCLGTGAYGSVWLASEKNTGKQVAIKFYTHRRGLDWSLLNREVEKLAVLYTSRDIIGLLQVGWDADPPYYVMEYLQNGSLSRLLEHGALPVHDAVRLITALTTALAHAHQSGILHCDIKPANVLLDGDFSPRLADFGQARLSHEQSPALGTLFYMAPEQADLNAAPDPRWDVYALGALLYHMLTGAPPFRCPENEARIHTAESLEDKLAAYRDVVTKSPRPTRHRETRGVDSRLADIVDRCLAPDPARRYSSPQAVLDALAARARYRSLRPLIGLGIILPGLLLLGLFPLALKAVNNAVETSSKNIALSALQSDLVAAKFLAYSLADEMTVRTRTVSELANDAELLPLMPGATTPADSPERHALAAWLLKYKQEVDQSRSEQNLPLDESWFLNDAQGFQRWRDPPSDKSEEENFSWRDYFHGQGSDRPDWKGRTDIPPLRTAHVSAPYRSTTTGQWKVGISVPIWDKDKERVLGILCRTIGVGELLALQKSLIAKQTGGDNNRIIGLVEVKTGQVLDHPWMSPENLKKVADRESFDQLQLADIQRQSLVRLQELVLNGESVGRAPFDFMYFDPIAGVDAEAERDYGGAWLAAFWPVGETGWVALVQEQREKALRPVHEIRDGLINYAMIGLALAVTLVIMSWYFVRRVVTARPFGISRRAFANGNGDTSRTGSLRTGG
jgi:eukaryotic-like serine/threonine-protein kinase